VFRCAETEGTGVADVQLDQLVALGFQVTGTPVV